MIGPLAAFADDAFNIVRRYGFGWMGSAPVDYEGKNGGKYGSPEFFQDARRGDYRALARMEKDYGHAWGNPLLRGQVEREILRDTAKMPQRMALLRGKRVPKGLLSGHYGLAYNRVANNLWGKVARDQMLWTMPMAAFSMASAPKGKMAERGLEMATMTAGAMVGGAVGGAFGGPIGEFLGQLVGGTVGEKAGAVVAPLEELGREAHHANFGGDYHDTEVAYTMRQRAVQEMGASALNARMYLGKEAALFHQ
jgi:hypothetical protein